MVQWIDPKNQRRHKETFGYCKPIATQEEFTLVDAGIPDGAMVKFSSYVWAIGEYENDRWFKVKKSVSEGASFRQTGTAFKGWFEYAGSYNFPSGKFLADLSRGTIKAGSIARVQYCQDAAVSAYLFVDWIDPEDESRHTKHFLPYKPVGTRKEFRLVDEGIPDGSMVRFSSYVAAVGEYQDNNWFKLDKSGSTGATFRQTGTAFKGWFEYIGSYSFHMGASWNIQSEAG
ncbi:hypothetical protein B0H11DRAFT_2061561 [Mycena galericulata]|nr:hypothetical protein B0H11DRAFT_2061561 [Mycena galericulata]